MAQMGAQIPQIGGFLAEGREGAAGISRRQGNTSVCTLPHEPVLDGTKGVHGYSFNCIACRDRGREQGWIGYLARARIWAGSRAPWLRFEERVEDMVEAVVGREPRSVEPSMLLLLRAGSIVMGTVDMFSSLSVLLQLSLSESCTL